MITNQFAPNVEGSLNTTIMFKDWYGRNSETKNGWLSEDFGAVNAMQFIESFLTLYFRINSMKQTLSSVCSKDLLLVRLWDLKTILVK